MLTYSKNITLVLVIPSTNMINKDVVSRSAKFEELDITTKMLLEHFLDEINNSNITQRDYLCGEVNIKKEVNKIIYQTFLGDTQKEISLPLLKRIPA